jgi:DNA repair protein RecO
MGLSVLISLSMRHKYATKGIVLARSPIAEESTLLTILTEDLGLVRARAQGLRKPGAKLASTLQTLAEAELVLVRGKEGWRLSGAVPLANRFQEMSGGARAAAARVTGLVLRLVAGEANDSRLYATVAAFLEALAERASAEHDAAECLAALRILNVLGLDAGEVSPLQSDVFGAAELSAVASSRSAIVARINRGIAASGL